MDKRIIYEVSRHNAYGGPPGFDVVDVVCSIALKEGNRYNRVKVPCDDIRNYRVGDEYVEPTEPNISVAVDELRKAVQDLFLVVDLALRPTAPYQESVKDDVVKHLTACRKHLGVE